MSYKYIYKIERHSWASATSEKCLEPLERFYNFRKMSRHSRSLLEVKQKYLQILAFPSHKMEWPVEDQNISTFSALEFGIFFI